VNFTQKNELLGRSFKISYEISSTWTDNILSTLDEIVNVIVEIVVVFKLTRFILFHVVPFYTLSFYSC